MPDMLAAAVAAFASQPQHAPMQQPPTHKSEARKRQAAHWRAKTSAEAAAKHAAQLAATAIAARPPRQTATAAAMEALDDVVRQACAGTRTVQQQEPAAVVYAAAQAAAEAVVHAVVHAGSEEAVQMVMDGKRAAAAAVGAAKSGTTDQVAMLHSVRMQLGLPEFFSIVLAPQYM